MSAFESLRPLRRLPLLMLLPVFLGTLDAQAPGVDWRRADWWTDQPPPSIALQSQDTSGEDWWYFHTSSYDSSGTLQGYIAAGYSTLPNYSFSEANKNGCTVIPAGGSGSRREFESTGNLKGPSFAAMALVHKDGTSNYWYKLYTPGWLQRVIQTKDGGYVGVGVSYASRNFHSTEPLYYNPGETPGAVTDAFTPGQGCANPGENKRHIYVVKVNSSGSVVWQYIYGMESYRDTSGNPVPAKAYKSTGEAFNVLETAAGNFLVVGQSDDVSATFFCNNNNNTMKRAFLLEIDSAGIFKSKRFLDTKPYPTNATGIAVVRDNANIDHYVISGTEWLQSSTGSFNGYTGCTLYQRVQIQQLNSSFAQEWSRSLFNSTSPLYESTSQNNFDVQVNSYPQYDINLAAYKQKTDILLPAIVDCIGCLYSAFNRGVGKVYRLDSLGNLIDSVTLPRTLSAYDLRMRVAGLLDGGFAAISSVRDPDPPVGDLAPPVPSFPLPSVPANCTGYDVQYWNTDAYVARFKADGGLLWDMAYPNSDPTGNSFSPGTAPAQSIRTDYPKDWKLQECVYSISQSQDGGFVVSGNNSYNFDDSYIMKLKPEAPAAPGGLLIRDTPLDQGAEPNPDTGPMWVSDDVWISSSSACNPLTNPVYQADGTPNYVCVKVTNTSTITKSGILKVYWAKASTGLDWPTKWIGYSLGAVTAGDILGSTSVSVAANSSTVVALPWVVPNPNDFSSFGADQSHFCLLARVEDGAFTYPEISSVAFNVRYNAKIAWRNVTVQSLDGESGFVTIRNLEATPAIARLAIALPKMMLSNQSRTLLNFGSLELSIPPAFYERWVQGGKASNGVTEIAQQPQATFKINTPDAWLGNLALGPGETLTASLSFKKAPSATSPTPQQLLSVEAIQYSLVRGGEFRQTGGQRVRVSAEVPGGGNAVAAPSIRLSPTVAEGGVIRTSKNPFVLDASATRDPAAFAWTSSSGARFQAISPNGARQSVTFATGPGRYPILLMVTSPAGIRSIQRFTLDYQPEIKKHLAVYFVSRTDGSNTITIGVKNMGSVPIENVRVTGVSFSLSTGGIYKLDPGLTLPAPFAAASLAPGAIAHRELSFKAVGRERGAPLHFIARIQASRIGSFLVHLNAPEQAPALSLTTESRLANNTVRVKIRNTGTAAVEGVQVASVTGVASTIAGASFRYASPSAIGVNPLSPLQSIPAGGSIVVDLPFESQSGSADAPFRFVLTLRTRDNAARSIILNARGPV